MEIEKKIEKPIRIVLVSTAPKLNHVKEYDENGKEILTKLINGGVIFGDERYGIQIGSENSYQSYATQFKVGGISILGNTIRVYEEGKYNPWIFSFDGKLIEPASFFTLAKNNIAFLKEKFSLNDNVALSEFLISHEWDLDTYKLFSDQTVKEKDVVEKYGDDRLELAISQIIS